MIETVINTIHDILLPLGAVGVFVGAIIEEILAPVPSPLVMMSAGFFFLEGSFSIEIFKRLVFLVAFPYALGVTVGSFLLFFLAFFSGEAVFNKWGHWFGLSWRQIERIQERFKGTGKDELVIFGLRVIPIVPSVVIAAFCGLIRMDVKKYILITFFGVFLRGLAFGIIGWYVGSLYYRYALEIARIEKFTFLLLIVVLIFFFLWKYLRRKRHTER